MGLDYTQERYVRLFVRDTTSWKMGPWQARAMLPQIMRKLDRAGVLDLGEDGVEALAVMTDMPLDVTQTGLAWWLKRGTLKLIRGNLVMPNFLEAQEAPQEDAQRARESRARKRDRAMAEEAGLVTKRDDVDTKRDDRVGAPAPALPATGNTTVAPTGQPSGDVTNRDGLGTNRDASVTKDDDAVTRSHNQSLCAVPSRAVPSLAVQNRASETTEISTESSTGSSEPASSFAKEIREVFDYWAARRSQLTGCSLKSLTLSKARQTKIRARLRENYTVEDLKLGVDGIFSLDFNVSEGHTDIELVCRDASKLDRYIAAARKAQANSVHADAGVGSGTAGHVVNGQIIRYADE